MEPLRIGSFMEELGPCPCPTDGCDGTGALVRIGDREIAVSCPACQERSDAEIEAEIRQERIDSLLSHSGLTTRTREFTLDTYPTDAAARKAKEAVLAWRDLILADARTAPSLYIHGPFGCGKTGLMAAVVRSLCEEGVATRIIDYPSLLEEMKQAFNHKEPFDVFSNVSHYHVLVIDDVGAERPTEWARSQLLQLVNYRYERQLTTAYVSNYAPDDLATRLAVDEVVEGGRIVSRIVEGAIQHRIDHKNRR